MPEICKKTECAEIAEYIDEYIHGECDDETEEKFRIHILSCESCEKFYNGEKALNALIKAAAFIPESTVSKSVLERINTEKPDTYFPYRSKIRIPFGLITAAAVVAVMFFMNKTEILHYFNPPPSDIAAHDSVLKNNSFDDKFVIPEGFNEAGNEQQANENADAEIAMISPRIFALDEGVQDGNNDSLAGNGVDSVSPTEAAALESVGVEDEQSKENTEKTTIQEETQDITVYKNKKTILPNGIVTAQVGQTNGKLSKEYRDLLNQYLEKQNIDEKAGVFISFGDGESPNRDEIFAGIEHTETIEENTSLIVINAADKDKLIQNMSDAGIEDYYIDDTGDNSDIIIVSMNESENIPETEPLISEAALPKETSETAIETVTEEMT